MAKNKGAFRPMMTSEQRTERKKQLAREKKMGMSCDGPSFFFPQTIEFNVDQLPEIKEWEVGENYQITIKVRQKSFEERKKEGKKTKEEARFEILAVKADSKLNNKQQTILDKMSS